MKFNRRCPIGGSFWPRGIYSVVNHARITTGQTSVCATEPVRAAGCPGGLLHGRAAVGQRCGGTAGHLRTSGPHLGGWAVVSGVLHWRHSGKFAVAADSAARRPAPAPADGGDIGDGGGAGCVQRCGPLDWRWRRRGFFGDHGGRWCRHRSLQRRLHRHDLQHVARGTAGRATAHPRCRGVGAGHRRHIGDCADAGPWQRDGALSRSAVAGRRRSGLLRHRGAVRRPDAVCVRHNRHPNATAGNLLDGLRDRPLPAVVSPVYDDLPAVRSDQPGHHVLQPARRPVQRQSARAGDPFQHWIGRRFDAVATACSGCVACCWAAHCSTPLLRCCAWWPSRVGSGFTPGRTARRSCWLRWPLKRWSPHRYRGSASSRPSGTAPP